MGYIQEVLTFISRRSDGDLANKKIFEKDHNGYGPHVVRLRGHGPLIVHRINWGWCKPEIVVGNEVRGDSTVLRI